ncbi:MAG: nucleotidyltransferase domain-containing protein [Gammaproteobacteria bacterium]|mgnify:FL=1|jgi:predicted nucleotidyltransferase|nr:nucleotidyltransferase domain-containing protein [Gammaproteobacteria bacterium]MBT4146896.1 nucleotidyltransferase domain-containing protein [Gammaproteobacteria bacterium]MBT5222129.1 nucleotidyltransferase domain-containing protein [Gammaproteobacteria bacterium]MBT7436710.1 nucleotidyltransferase domain-containing protein [Gammaproteobacteria bacterium]
MTSLTLKKIIALAEKNVEIEVLWLYGSQARGNTHENSDYDLAIAFKTYIKDPVERRLRPEMLTLEWRKKLSIPLSIIDINQVPLPLAYTVLQDNTTLYSHNDYRKMTEEQKIMSKWEIDYLYHRKHYA